MALVWSTGYLEFFSDQVHACAGFYSKALPVCFATIRSGSPAVGRLAWLARTSIIHNKATVVIRGPVTPC
jgi:hypothetical protein